MDSSPQHPAFVIDRDGLDLLMSEVRDAGYRLMGPAVRDGVIRYDEVESSKDLPVGWRDVQEKGTYRLRRRDDNAVFGFAMGQDSLKGSLFPQPSNSGGGASRKGDGRLRTTRRRVLPAPSSECRPTPTAPTW